MANRLKTFLKNCPYTKGVYQFLKKFKPDRRFAEPSFFYNVAHGSKTCCIILAGYKDFLWDIVFKRISMFAPDGMDICVVSSGLYSERLLNICQTNNWSYLCIKRNCVTLALNTAIRNFPQAEYLYKIDEDIFVTKNFFQKTRECYDYCEGQSEYIPGFVAPLIPINGYGHLRILKKLSKEDEYSARFERPLFAAGRDRMIENSSEVSKYFWNDIFENIRGGIDALDRQFAEDLFCFSVCPIRFSIGAIFFKRELWEEMGYFDVSKEGSGLGGDEVKLCSLAMNQSKAIIVSENTVVGHLSFGKQNDAMKEFFIAHPERFMIH